MVTKTMIVNPRRVRTSGAKAQLLQVAEVQRLKSRALPMFVLSDELMTLRW